jgi:hypothetical protein
MRTRYLIAFAILVCAAPGYCADTLSFNGAGYSLMFAVSGESPTIANIHFAAPNAKSLTSLSAGEFKVVLFDLQKHLLRVTYSGSSATTGIPPFTLVVKGSNGVLTIRGKRISGKFDWTI